MQPSRSSGQCCTKALTAAALLMMATAASGATTSLAADWQYAVKIYGWLPSLSGDLRYAPRGSSGSIDVDADSILDALQMTFMGAFEARRGPWSGFTDVIYLKLAGDQSKSVTVPDGAARTLFDADLDLKGWVWTLGGSYTIWRNQASHLDLLAGARLLSLDTDLELTGGGSLQRERKLSESVALWDGLLGAKGRLGLNARWFLPYYLDVGTGDTELTWQATAGVGYAFDWGELSLMYRHLAYDQGGDKLLQDIAFSGGVLGVSFRF